MSAGVTPSDIDARRHQAHVDHTLTAVDGLLDGTLYDLRAVLAEAGSRSRDSDPREDPEPPTLDVDLVQELGERVANHGKRIRPRLAHWGWALADGPDPTHPDLVRIGAALELLHLFALVQDDVMDRSETRRGRPALHVVAAGRHRDADALGDPELFGDSVAVLVADLALSEASLLVAPTAPQVRAAWRLMTVELVDGQLLDVTHTAGRRRDLATSRRIARFKSGRYTITRPLQLGALVAGVDPEQLRRIVAWGDLVGDAFAVRDDLLGVWGDPALTGKPAGDDLLAGKPTVLLTWAHELLPDSARPLLDACDAGVLDAEGVAALQDAMEAAGVRQRAEDEVTTLAEQALDDLGGLGTEPAAEAALRDLVESIAWRSS
jgi:geranylgeranyl diphosphate synthase, type I